MNIYTKLLKYKKKKIKIFIKKIIIHIRISNLRLQLLHSIIISYFFIYSLNKSIITLILLIRVIIFFLYNYDHHIIRIQNLNFLPIIII